MADVLDFLSIGRKTRPPEEDLDLLLAQLVGNCLVQREQPLIACKAHFGSLKRDPFRDIRGRVHTAAQRLLVTSNALAVSFEVHGWLVRVANKKQP